MIIFLTLDAREAIICIGFNFSCILHNDIYYVTSYTSEYYTSKHYFSERSFLQQHS